MSGGPINRLAQRVRAWAERTAAIRALFWYGGYGYGRLTPSSDLDMAVLLSTGANVFEVAEQLVANLRAEGEPVAYHVTDARERRLTAWLGEELTKLDVVFGRTAEELAWLADASDVPPPRLTAAWSVRDEDVLDLLHRASRLIPELDAGLRRERGEWEIDKFLIAFEACSMAHAQGDVYAFYFQYNLALGRLARLVQLSRVGHLHLYLPRNLLGRALSPGEQAAFSALSGTLQLADAHARKHALAGALLEATEEARVALGVRREPAELKAFLERIQLRDGLLDKGHP